MKIQIDIPKDINKKLKVEKIERELNTMAELILIILGERYNEQNIPDF